MTSTFKTCLRNVVTASILLMGFTFANAQNLAAGKRALEMEKFTEARKIFSDLLSHENGGEIYYYMGETYFIKDKIDSARTWFEKGIAANPKSPINYVGLGKIQLYSDKTSEAKANFETASKLGKDKDPIILSLIAGAYIATPNKYTNEALDYANKAVELKKNKPEALIVLGDIKMQKADGGGAISSYIDAYEMDKTNPLPQVRIGKINNYARLFKDSKEAYEKAIEIDPAYAPVYKELAELYIKYAQYQRAEDLYRKHLELSEVTIDKEIRLAQILFLNKKYKEVTDMFNAILQKDSTNIYLYRLNAYTSYEVGKYEEGLKDMEKFLANIKSDRLIASDYVYYSKLLTKTPGKDSLAIVALEKAIDLDSSDTQLFLDLGTMYTAKGKHAETVRVMERMVNSKTNPNTNDYYYLGRAYYTNQDYAKADSAYAFVAQMMPESSSGWLGRAKASYYLDTDGTKALAKPYAEKFIELALKDTVNLKRYTRDLVNAYEYLGYYYFMKKDHVKAEEYYKALLALEPANSKAQKYFEQRKKK